MGQIPRKGTWQSRQQQSDGGTNSGPCGSGGSSSWGGSTGARAPAAGRQGPAWRDPTPPHEAMFILHAHTEAGAMRAAVGPAPAAILWSGGAR